MDIKSFSIKREHVLFLSSIGILLFIAVQILANPLRVNYDVAILLGIGRLLLNGAVPYVDYVDINPPLIHYISAIPAILGQLLDKSEITIFSWLIYFLTILSIALVIYVFLVVIHPRSSMTIAASIIFTISILSFKVLAFNAWGQREQIFLLLFIPYMVLSALSIESKGSARKGIRFAIGVLAGIGICIKPHFILIWLAIEIIRVLRGQSLRSIPRPELFGVILIGAIYAIHFVFLSEEVINGMMDVVIMLQGGGHKAYGDLDPVSFLTRGSVAVLLSVAPFIFVVKDVQYRNLLELTGVFTISSLLVLTLQGRGFLYHYIPIWFGEYLILFLGVFISGSSISLREVRSDNKIKITKLLSTLITASAYFVFVFVALRWADILSPAFFSVTQEIENSELVHGVEMNSEEGSSVFVISTSTDAFRSVLQADRDIASRYMPSYPIAFSTMDIDYIPHLYTEVDNLPAMLKAYLIQEKEWIRSTNPDLIVIDNNDRCQGCPPFFNIYEFLTDLGFIEDVISENYGRVGEFNNHVLYKKLDNP